MRDRSNILPAASSDHMFANRIEIASDTSSGIDDAIEDDDSLKDKDKAEQSSNVRSTSISTGSAADDASNNIITVPTASEKKRHTPSLTSRHARRKKY